MLSAMRPTAYGQQWGGVTSTKPLRLPEVKASSYLPVNAGAHFLYLIQQA